MMLPYALNRKRLFSSSVLVAVMATLVLLVAACSSSDEGNAASSGDIKTGGTLKVGMLSDHVGYDIPHLVGLPDLVTVQHTNDTLVFREPDLTIRPALAESWTYNADASVWTFKLRKGVHFKHYEDGKINDVKEFKAEDVIFTINRMFDTESPVAGTVASEKPTMVAEDDYTLRMEFAGPNATLLEGLVKYQALIHPSNIDPARFTQETFGTGPFILTEAIVGERTSFVKNPDYFMPGVPVVDELIYLMLPSPEARAEALKAGTIDMIYDLDNSSIPGLLAHAETDVQLAPSGGYMNLAMIVTEPPFDNLQVRKAIQLATDRNAVLQGAQFGYGSIAYDHPIAPTDPRFNSDCMPPDYDPAAAKALLESAGIDVPLKLTLHTSSAGGAMVEMATVLKESFKPAGIDLDIVVMPEDGYWAEGWMVKPFTTVWWGGRPPYEGFNVVYKGGGSWNESFYKNDRVDALLLEAKGAAALEDQKRIYGEIQCIVVEEVPRIVVVFRPVSLGVRIDVRGSAPMWDATMSLHNVWLDR